MPASGMPMSAPPGLNVTPLGRAPVSLKVGAGKPVAVTVNAPAVPTVNVVLLALVMAAAWFTVRAKDCWALPAVLVAIRVMLYKPPVLAAGVPESVPVPSPLLCKITGDGRAPDSLIVALGEPVVVTVNEPGVPTWKVVLAPLVNVGTEPIVKLEVVVLVSCTLSVPVTISVPVPV